VIILEFDDRYFIVTAALIVCMHAASVAPIACCFIKLERIEAIHAEMRIHHNAGNEGEVDEYCK